MIQDICRSFALLERRTRWRWAGLLPLALAAAAIEAIAAASVFGLLLIVTDPARATNMSVASSIYRYLPWQDAQSVVLSFTVVVMAVYLVRNVVLSIASYLQARMVYGSAVEMSCLMLSAYVEAPYALLLGRNSAELIERVRSSTEMAATFVLAAVVQVVTEVLIVVCFIGLLAATAPLVTLVAIVATLALLLLPLIFSNRLVRGWGQQQQALEESLFKDLQQSLGAVKEVKLAGCEQFFYERFRQGRHALAWLQRRRASLSDRLRLVVETTFVVALLLVVVIVTLQGTPGVDTLSLLGLYAYAGFRLVPSANRITLNVNNIRHGRAFVRELHADLVNLRSGTPRRPSPAPEPGFEFRDSIVFSGVGYSYGQNRQDALLDVDLVIGRGESVGIVGPTGAGKSTMVDLLLGLLEPTTGHVLVDGRNVQLSLRAWQRQIGYVPQSFYLLDDSLRSNVAFGLDPDKIDEDRLRRAIRMAQLDDVLVSLPQGLDTPLGERGVRLSGGQRQRVAIARALYHDPPVLVFDEATAALDVQTELEIARAIEALHGARTLIVIAHRLATIRRCDRVVFMRAGRIAAVGSFDQLVQSDAEFRAMAELDT